MGHSMAGGRGSVAHRGGREDGMCYMRVLFSEIPLLFLNHRMSVASLMVNSMRLVVSRRA